MSNGCQINVDNRFAGDFFKSLAKDNRIEEIENDMMEDGCFFIHLRFGFSWNYDLLDSDPRRSISFDSRREAKAELRRVITDAEKYNQAMGE